MRRHFILPYLSIDTALNCPAVYGDIFLSMLQAVSLSNPDHLLHKVQASNTLCDWMLYLGSEVYQRSTQCLCCEFCGANSLSLRVTFLL